MRPRTLIVLLRNLLPCKLAAQTTTVLCLHVPWVRNAETEQRLGPQLGRFKSPKLATCELGAEIIWKCLHLHVSLLMLVVIKKESKVQNDQPSAEHGLVAECAKWMPRTAPTEGTTLWAGESDAWADPGWKWPWCAATTCQNPTDELSYSSFWGSAFPQVHLVAASRSSRIWSESLIIPKCFGK